MKSDSDKYAVSFEDQFTLRGMVLAALGSTLITASSAYVALRMGALPWPTIFVTILSMTVLKTLGNTNLNEINITSTAMSTGGMVAGGVAFTIPGIWMIKGDAVINPWELFLVVLSGTILGVIFCALYRRQFIEEMQLPYPMGQAAADTLLAGDEGGSKAKYLFSSLGIVAAFTALRDQWNLIPSAWTPQSLWKKNIQFGAWISPMALGIGYIIGPLYTLSWFAGAVLSYLIIIPVTVNMGIFDAASATAFTNSLGIGIIVGGGIGLLFKSILPQAKTIFGSMFRNQDSDLNLRWAPLAMAVIALLLTVFTEMSLVSSIIVIAGVWLTTAMAAMIDGQTGIDPMEIFGIIVLLVIKAVSKPGFIESFFIACVVAIACGLAGDSLQDYKSGYILHSSPKALVYGEAIGGIVGAVVSPIVIFVMHQAYGAMGPGTQLVAPQAYAVSTMVSGLPNPTAFAVGLLVGIILYWLNLPATTIGIGVYLPMYMSTTAALGGLIRILVNKYSPKAVGKGELIASGALGGEGVTGVIIAIVHVLSGT